MQPRRFLLPVLLLILLGTSALAADRPKRKAKEVKSSPYSDAYVDTVNLRKKLSLNDYTMIGFEYGVSRNTQLFTPRFQSKPVYFPEYYGVTLTRYGRLIDSPVVGLQIGAFYGHEGYEFKDIMEKFFK